jgi:hypothetical protein
MVKSLISIAVVTCLLVVGSLYEINHVNKQFDDFNQVLTVLYDKIEDQTATTDDVYAVQDNWLNKKKMLHVFIPHTEIKEVDLWIAETATLVRDKQWEDAISKMEVLLELSEQIPQTFKIRFSNIF